MAWPSTPLLSDTFTRWERPATVILLGLPASVIAAATLVPNGATRIYSWPWAFYVQASLIAPWLWCAWRAARGLVGMRAAWSISAPILIALSLSVATSSHGHESLEAGLVLATPLVLVAFLAEVWSKLSVGRRDVALSVVGAFLGLVALVGLVRCFADAPSSDLLAWFLVQRNPHPLGHQNYTAGLALFALPLLTHLVIRYRGIRRGGWTALTLVAFVYFVSAGSRGGWVGLVVAIGVAGTTSSLRGRRSRRATVLVWASVATVAAIAIVANPRLRHSLSDPLATLRSGKSEQQRVGFILTGLRIAQSHPWTGIGPGTTPHHYPEHRVDIPGSLENSFQLHCAPLQWWVDTGGIGLLALFVTTGALTRRLWRVRSTLTPTAAVATSTLAGYGAFAITDYQLDAPIFPILLSAATAILVAESEAAVRTPVANSGRSVIAALLAAIPVAVAVLLVPSWRARASFAEAWHAKDAGAPLDFLQNLRFAARTASWHPIYHDHLARALTGIATRLPPETAAALLLEARGAWETSLAASPFQDHPWLNLGWLDWNEGRLDDAERRFSKAATIAPNRTGVWLAMALTRLQRGDLTGTARGLEFEIRVNPRFVTSPLWLEEPLMSLRAPVLEALARDDSERFDTPANSTALAVLARWWWQGTILPGELTKSGDQPLTRFLAALGELDAREVAPPVGSLSRELAALRELWLRTSPKQTSILGADLASAWADHVSAHRGEPFSALLKSYPHAGTRHVQRGAAGILFRQTDGDPLSDLTEIPSHGLDALLPIPEPVYIRREVRR